MPPLTADPYDRKNFFLCATRIYRYTKDPFQNRWFPSLWSTHNFQASGGEYVSALEFSPLDPQRGHAVTNRGRLFWSTDGGVTWTQSASLGPTGQYFYGTALHASSIELDTVWVAGSGYGNATSVYRSTDGGQSYQAWDQGLPDTLVYCLAEAPNGTGVLFCGTETAAYRRDPGAAGWVDVTAADAPITTYWSAESLPHENTIRFGTYGRGIWDYRIEPQAVATVHNGGGTNPLCFASPTGPVLGANWTPSVDASGSPGASTSGFLIHAQAASGSFVKGYELLVDLGSPRYLQVLRPSSGGIDAFSLPVPPDTSLAGLSSTAQGLVLGNDLQLCNAVDLVAGY